MRNFKRMFLFVFFLGSTTTAAMATQNVETPEGLSSLDLNTIKITCTKEDGRFTLVNFQRKDLSMQQPEVNNYLVDLSSANSVYFMGGADFVNFKQNRYQAIEVHANLCIVDSDSPAVKEGICMKADRVDAIRGKSDRIFIFQNGKLSVKKLLPVETRQKMRSDPTQFFDSRYTKAEPISDVTCEVRTYYGE